ncbi:MAG: glucoamylase family protein [Bacteroidales bacterium]
MLKRFYLVKVLFLFTTILIAANDTFTKTHFLKGDSYPGHIELQWENHRGFDYDIYKKTGSKFKKCAETSANYYFDFKATNGADEVYRIVPRGMSVNQATDFEVKVNGSKAKTDEAYLDMLQKYTTRYFYEYAHPENKLARERSNNNVDIVTTGGTGFGIMALIAGVERGYYTRREVLENVTSIVEFLSTVERFHGAWAHWYNGNTGEVFSFSKYDNGGDLVETAFLVQGLLTARSYFNSNHPDEIKLCSRITRLWEDVEWDWYTQGSDDALYWHWSKQYEFKMNHKIRGFDETLITYVLAASSPTHPISKQVYESCYKKSDYYHNGKEYYGIKLDLGMPYGGPLFFTHYSFLGLNPTTLKEGNVNYYDRNRAHVLIHQAYAKENPKGHNAYGEDFWGFTSSDDALVGYTSHHPGTDAENGTITPTAGLSSFPYAPEACMKLLKNLYHNHGQKTWGPYGFYDSYNPSLCEGQQVVKSYLAIDQGPIAVMIENYRSGLIWDLFMKNTEIKRGLEKLGFEY